MFATHPPSAAITTRGAAITLVSLALLAAARLAGAQEPPYPPSGVITGIAWAPVSTIARAALESDNWPITWGDDDHQYTAFGDGWGFDPGVPGKLSLGFARIAGPASDWAGANIHPSNGEQTGDGASGKKASGMLMVDGVLYMWVRNADNAGRQSQLAVSTDRAETWTWSDWTFPELGYCIFLNFGKNYAGARDDYVYTYSPDTPSAYNETDDVVLARVPKDRILDRTAYEFVSGFDAQGNPTWSSDISERTSIFRFPGGCNRLDVTYHAPLGRYLMVQRSAARAGGVAHFSIYDAPEPWGPWTTAFFTTTWDTDPGESGHLPSKWMSSDGTSLHLVFSCGDSFSVREATLTIGGDVMPPAAPTDLRPQ
jgi:hypothetical protein